MVNVGASLKALVHVCGKYVRHSCNKSNSVAAVETAEEGECADSGLSGEVESASSGVRGERAEILDVEILGRWKQAANCGARLCDPQLGATFNHCCRRVKSPEIVSCCCINEWLN